MRLRSLLFVPGDRPERMAKALRVGADALILDLEDAVAITAKSGARAAVAAFLRGDRQGVRVFVRINPLDTGLAKEDLAAIGPIRPDGIVLPKAEGTESLLALKQALSQQDLAGVPVLAIVTETPKAMFQIGEYSAEASRRLVSLVGLTWGAEDLPAAIGAVTAREEDGSYTAPYQLARSLTLFGASAAGIAAIETVYPDFRDGAGLARYAALAARDGFTGMMAIHPDQVAIINTAFTPSAAAIAQARAVVAAFDANPGIGALSLAGRMIDAPHLKQAKRVLQQIGEY